MNKPYHKEVSISKEDVTLKGELTIPPDAGAVIVFSHGSGSSRFSKRNQHVAKYLNNVNFGTLLFDLLTEDEDKYYQNRFNINLLTKRLTNATEWLKEFPVAKGCRIGYFGASTGAASALQAAAQIPDIASVVSRGGRPDLALDYLHQVTAPTLLIVGGLDLPVIEMNKEAYRKLKCTKELVIVEGASHLFEEAGKMDEVSKLAGSWFGKYLQPIKA